MNTRTFLLILSALLPLLLRAQPDARASAHAEAFFKALTDTKAYRIEITITQSKGATTGAPLQKGLVVRAGNDFYSDLMGRQTVLVGGHFVVVERDMRTIFHQPTRTGAASVAPDAGWGEVEKKVKESIEACKLVASDARTVTISVPGQEEGITSIELVLGLKDHLPQRVTYRLKEPLEDGSDRMEVLYRFLPPDPAADQELLHLGRYIRKRPDGTYGPAPAFKDFRLIEPERS